MPDDVGLGSQSAFHNTVSMHDYWTITQANVGHSITYWTCEWNRLVYSAGVFNNQIYKFRNIYNNINNRTIMLTDTNTKKEFLKYFLYQLIDYRIEYIRQNNFTANGVNKAQFLRDNLADYFRTLIV